MRVTRGEVRIYPTVTFEAEPSKYLAKLGEDLLEFSVKVIDTEFEFLRNSNNFLQISR